MGTELLAGRPPHAGTWRTVSWDADFYFVVDGDRIYVQGWNYTHNCNEMANKALDTETLRAGAIRWWMKHDRPDIVARVEEGTRSGIWWECLDGLNGADGAALLTRIVGVLGEAPEFFREMNPPNGWGDYDSFLETLAEMREIARTFPSGIWECSG